MFTAVTDDDAQATVDAAWNAGIRYFDTAPLYGHGRAERRLGRSLATRPRDEYVLSSKVGRVLVRTEGPMPDTIFRDVGDVVPRFDFSRDGVLRSLDDSLARLGTDHLDVVLVHDPDDHEGDARRGAFPALVQLRDEGVVRAIGAGMNQVAMLERFVADIDLDCILLAGRYSLLDQSGAGLLAACLERGVGVILGGVFNSGVLADPDARAAYDYADAPAEVVARARELRARCAAHGVPLPAAAVQFALRHPGVSTVVVGARTAAESAFDVAAASVDIPEHLWRELGFSP
jgi:D-threo-aldose 1-dehydrogenase